MPRGREGVSAGWAGQMGSRRRGRHCEFEKEAIKLICLSFMNEALAVAFGPINAGHHALIVAVTASLISKFLGVI